MSVTRPYGIRLWCWNRCLSLLFPITDGNNCVERIECSLVLLSFPFNSSMLSGYFHFGNNHFFVQLPFIKDMCQMLANGRNANPKQLSHRFLSSPNSFIFDYHLYLSFIVRQMV